MTNRNKIRLGPAVLVTAAFIGPGTVMTASRAGAEFGFSLLWAILFSVVTAIVLQEMAARLGIVSRQGLAEAIRSGLPNKFVRALAIGLILSAILFGNSAYQTGNLLGAAAGMEILSNAPAAIWVVSIGLFASIIISIGRFAVLQWALTFLVALMGVIFLLSAILCGPQLVDLLSGFKPSFPTNSGWVIIGLVGTTVVPYNLFLHASAAANDSENSTDQKLAVRRSFLDTIIAISIGGIITAALLVTSAVTFNDSEIGSIKDIAQQLRPGLGVWAERMFAIGLFAAGLTSSITAPVAAAFATAGCFGWKADLADVKLKLIAIAVIAVGLIFALRFGSSPQETIIIAQVANGVLLPIVAMFLIYTVNRSDLMGSHKNGWVANSLGGLILIVTIAIASRQFFSVWAKLTAFIENQ